MDLPSGYTIHLVNLDLSAGLSLEFTHHVGNILTFLFLI